MSDHDENIDWTVEPPLSSRKWSVKQYGNIVTLHVEGNQDRDFWVPSKGGYVREVSGANHGTLGNQVCRLLRRLGSTLSSHPDNLAALIRHEWRHNLAAEKRALNL